MNTYICRFCETCFVMEYHQYSLARGQCPVCNVERALVLYVDYFNSSIDSIRQLPTYPPPKGLPVSELEHAAKTKS